jgi:GT2 family glycosyltransferase
MENPVVYIIVLNWNHLDDLILTMESLIIQDYQNMKILISDNGSADGSQVYINENYPDAILLENNENLGWAGGNNVGIKYALTNDADYILLANNDLYIENTKIVSTLVNDLVKLKEKNIKIIGTTVNYYTPKDRTHNSGWILFPKSEVKGRVFNRYRKEYNIQLSNNYRVVDFVSGCFILIDKSVFNDIGFIDEAFFCYMEEADFSLRAWKAGHGSLINKDLIIYHKVASTAKVGSPFFMYLKFRNLYYFLTKHKTIISHYNYFIAKYFFDFSKIILKVLFYPNRYNGNQLRLLFASFRGLFDGVITKRQGRDGIKF